MFCSQVRPIPQEFTPQHSASSYLVSLVQATARCVLALGPAKACGKTCRQHWSEIVGRSVDLKRPLRKDLCQKLKQMLQIALRLDIIFIYRFIGFTGSWVSQEKREQALAFVRTLASFWHRLSCRFQRALPLSCLSAGSYRSDSSNNSE